MVYKYDFLIIGSGVAGMSYALKVARAHKGKVCMICKTSLDEANTSFAQGGVASVTNLEVDNFDKHIQDTMIAGDYISDYKAVKQVVTMAPEQIKELVQWGVNFDKQQDGKFDLHREGGHSEFRILHHADDTGAEIQRGLMEAVRNCPDIDIKENHFAVEIITQHHLGARVTRRTPYINCYGAYVLNPDTQKVDTYLSKVTVMCTGGCGAVYQTTTNPVIATGDGEAMVYRAKGTVADMEFVQFHPTALYHPGETHPAFLITEAMRGYGGILRLPNGEHFMDEHVDILATNCVAALLIREAAEQIKKDETLYRDALSSCASIYTPFTAAVHHLLKLRDYETSTFEECVEDSYCLYIGLMIAVRDEDFSDIQEAIRKIEFPALNICFRVHCLILCMMRYCVWMRFVKNSVPKDMYKESIEGRFDYKHTDTFMGFHCGNTCSSKVCNPQMKYQMIMARSLPVEVTNGTLEGDIVPGEITFYRLQSTADCKIRAYVAQGEVLPVATRSFGSIGVFAIKEMGRFYRHVLIEKNYPHHGAVAFGHYGKALFEVFKYLGVPVEDINYNQPASLPYKTENPFC